MWDSVEPHFCSGDPYSQKLMEFTLTGPDARSGLVLLRFEQIMRSPALLSLLLLRNLGLHDWGKDVGHMVFMAQHAVLADLLFAMA